jgi:hypothetical protein
MPTHLPRLAAQTAALLFLAFHGAAGANGNMSSYAATAIFVRDCRLDTNANGCPEQQFTEATLVERTFLEHPGGRSSSSSATSLLGSNAIAATSASVQLSDPISVTPTVRLGAFSTANSRTSAQTASVNGFSWNGNGGGSRYLNVGLDYSATDVVPTSGLQIGSIAAFSFLSVQVDIFSLSTPTFYLDDQVCAPGFEFGACLAQSRNDVQFLGSLSLSSVPDSTHIGGSIPVSFQAGRYYFIDVDSVAIAKGGAYIDALHTVTATFSSTEGLSALPDGVSSVPEPEPIALLGLGLLVLGVRKARAARPSTRNHSLQSDAIGRAT